MTHEQALARSIELADELIAAKKRIAELEAHVRRSIACIEGLRPYVMWDGVDGEDEQTKVQTTLTLLRGAVRQ